MTFSAVTRFSLMACLTATLFQPVHAADYTWGNTGTDFNTTGNWTTAGVPGAGDNAIFSAPPVTYPDLSLDTTVNQLRFDVTGYTVSSATDHVLTLMSTAVHTSSGAALNGNIGSGSISTVNVALVLGASSGSTQAFRQTLGGTLEINGVVSGGSSASTLDLGGNGGTIRLTGQNTFQSKVTLSGSNTKVSVSSIGSTTSNGALGRGSSIQFNSQSTVLYTGAGETTDKAFILNTTNPGTLDISGATGALIVTGNVTGIGTGAKRFTLAGNTSAIGEIRGDISDGTGGGSMAVGISSGGKWTLSGNNSHTGGTTVTGSLNINSAQALGTGAFSIGVATPTPTIDNTSGAAVEVSTGNAVSIRNFTFTGSNDLSLGTGAYTLGATSTVTVSAKTLTFGGSVGGGNVGLTKEGAGTLVLAGSSNSYTGATTINAGKLVVDGSLASATTIKSGATLGGIGTLAAVTANGGSLIEIGDAGTNGGIGTLTFSSLSATAGTAFNFDLGSTSDFLSIAGAFTANTSNSLIFNLNNAGDLQANTIYTMLTYGSATNLTLSDLAIGSLSSGLILDSTFGNNGLNIVGNSIQVRFTAVPEPSTWILLLGGVGMLVVIMRRGRHRSSI